MKTVHGNFGVSGHNDAVCFPDLLVGKYVLGAAGTSRLHFDKTACCPGSFFQTFRCHIRVCDAGGAGGNGQDFKGAFCRSRILGS